MPLLLRLQVLLRLLEELRSAHGELVFGGEVADGVEEGVVLPAGPAGDLAILAEHWLELPHQTVIHALFKLVFSAIPGPGRRRASASSSLIEASQARDILRHGVC